MSRTCTKCLTTYAATLEFFPKQRLGKFGLSSHCRRCTSRYAQEWRKKRLFGKVGHRCKNCEGPMPVAVHARARYCSPECRSAGDARDERDWRNKRTALTRSIVHAAFVNGCVDCGEKDPDVLDFDHVRGTKVAGVSFMRSKMVALDKLRAEIAKCEVRCANCHRRATRRRERSA